MNSSASDQPFATGSKVRVRDTGVIGTVISHYSPGPALPVRVLVEKPHGHAGQAALRKYFDANQLEESA